MKENEATAVLCSSLPALMWRDMSYDIRNIDISEELGDLQCINKRLCYVQDQGNLSALAPTQSEHPELF